MQQEALSGSNSDLPDSDMPDLAESLVQKMRATRQPIPGIGHNIHKPVDPRAPRLFEIAAQNGLSGRYVRLMQEVAMAAERALNKPGQLPVNATGALGAIASEMGISWRLCRGLAVIGRSIGLVGHIAEELRNPIAREIWERTEQECSSHVQW
nr:citrate/2-methylcitrate synthase [Limnohabitans sp. Rim8]